MVRLKIFGSGMTSREVIIDGVRLGQPDGIKVADVFPELNKTNLSIFGLEIEFISTQSHVDLTSSECIIDFNYPSHTIRFRPIRVEEFMKSDTWLVDYKDLNASLILINNSNSDVKVNVVDRNENSLLNKSLISRSIWEERLKFSKDCILKSEDNIYGFIVLSEMQSRQVISVRKL